MKSDIEIKDDVFKIIKGSILEQSVTGKLSKTRRPNNSSKEDIIISILSSDASYTFFPNPSFPIMYPFYYVFLSIVAILF